MPRKGPLRDKFTGANLKADSVVSIHIKSDPYPGCRLNEFTKYTAN